MSHSPPAAAAERPERSDKPAKVFKLRTSCDACLTAKVRCDKGPAACRRCRIQGLACQYSPSLRAGKPPRHKARSVSDGGNGGEDAKRLAKQPTSRPKDVPSTHQQQQQQQQSADRRSPTPADLVRDDVLRSGTATPDLQMDGLRFDSLFMDDSWMQTHDLQTSSCSDDCSMQFGFSNDAPLMSSLSMANLGNDALCFSSSSCNSRAATPPTSYSNSSTSMPPFDHDMSALNFAEPPQMDFMASLLSEQHAHTHEHMTFPSTASTQDPHTPLDHDCGSIAVNMLVMLHNISGGSPPPQQPQGHQAFPPSPDSSAGRLDVSQEPLKTIRQAIDSVRSIFMCRCLMREDVALTCISIVSKILAWFQANLAKNGIDAITASRNSGPQKTFSAVGWEADTEALLNQVTLIHEMRRLVWLVHVLAERRSSAAAEESSYLEQHFAMLEQSLKVRLGGAIKKFTNLAGIVGSKYETTR